MLEKNIRLHRYIILKIVIKAYFLKTNCHEPALLEDRIKGVQNFLKISTPLEIFFVVKVYDTLRDSKYKFTF